MANYNTFVVINCKDRKNVLVTSSARKAKREMRSGIRVEVWSDNALSERIYFADLAKNRDPFSTYIKAEQEHIKQKQARAEKRNQWRREQQSRSGVMQCGKR